MTNWRKELRAISRRSPELHNEVVACVHEIYQAEGDRGAALVAGTLAENALERIIKTRLIFLSNEKLDELFGYEGTLGTFSNKIRAAFAFGIIDSLIRNDLDRIREIRNAFAHSLVAIDFRTPAIAKACRGFHAPLPDFVKGQIRKNRARDAYVDAATAIVGLANIVDRWEELGHLRKLNRVFTYDLVRASFDRLMKQLQRQIQKNVLAAKKASSERPATLRSI